MPNFDRTGPQGQGSRTGRGLGKCRPLGQRSEPAGEETNNTIGRGPGLGMRRGRGAGNGRRMGQ